MIAKGRNVEALTVMTKINGEQQAKKECQDIESELASKAGSLKELFSPILRKALLIGIVIMIYSQVNGVNMMLIYGPTILVEANIGDASQAIFFTIFINLTILVSTIIAFWLVKIYGRVQILLIGVSGMALGQLIMASVFFLGASPFLNLAAMIIAAGSFTLSLAPLSWIIVSEIFPNKVRGKAVSIVCFVLYISSFICAQFFPMITNYFETTMNHPGGAYLIFASICISCVIFCWRVLPETKDIPLEKMGEFWSNENHRTKD